MATSRTFNCVLSAIIGFILILPASAQRNVLLSGETLGTTERLTYGDVQFIMQGDCNLVLYNGRGGFQSNTARRGNDCQLTLTNYGQLIIKRGGNGVTVWNSPNSSNKEGKYAAVLRPDGVVSVYGPQVWSTPAPALSTGEVKLAVGNTLFSGQYVFILQPNGQAAIYGPIIWTVGTPPSRGGLPLSMSTL